MTHLAAITLLWPCAEPPPVEPCRQLRCCQKWSVLVLMGQGQWVEEWCSKKTTRTWLIYLLDSFNKTDVHPPGIVTIQKARLDKRIAIVKSLQWSHIVHNQFELSLSRLNCYVWAIETNPTSPYITWDQPIVGGPMFYVHHSDLPMSVHSQNESPSGIISFKKRGCSNAGRHSLVLHETCMQKLCRLSSLTLARQRMFTTCSRSASSRSGAFLIASFSSASDSKSSATFSLACSQLQQLAVDTCWYYIVLLDNRRIINIMILQDIAYIWRMSLSKTTSLYKSPALRQSLFHFRSSHLLRLDFTWHSTINVHSSHPHTWVMKLSRKLTSIKMLFSWIAWVF